jgi:glycosyltransferase involved in cell wall biosynthesis
VVTVSQFTAGEIIRRFGVDPARLVVCSPGAPDWQPRPAAPPGAPILFMGTLEPRKNVGLLLDAYALVRERIPQAPRLALAGAVTPAAADWVRRIAEPPLAGHVDLLGYIDAGRRYELYTSAAMLVLPSHLEGFGLPVLEAMTAGVPVIVSDRGALPEVAGGAAQVVPATDPAALADAILRYLVHPETAAAAVARGLARARAYSWAASARTLRAAYTEAVKALPRRA